MTVELLVQQLIKDMMVVVIHILPGMVTLLEVEVVQELLVKILMVQVNREMEVQDEHPQLLVLR